MSEEYDCAEWARHLTDDDEWVVRTALANIASDLERVADAEDTDTVSTTVSTRVLREAAGKYRATLARIEEGSV
jgi:hypothetical protein